MHIKVGDQVTIISGSNKNKTGKIIKINSRTGKIIIQGLNLKFKHQKANKENEIGKIQQIESPIHHSNVKLTIKES